MAIFNDDQKQKLASLLDAYEKAQRDSEKAQTHAADMLLKLKAAASASGLSGPQVIQETKVLMGEFWRESLK